MTEIFLKSKSQKAKVKMTNQKSKFKSNFIKRLIHFSLKILRLSKKLKSDSTFWPVIDQLVRSSTSIGANVVEAQSASSKRDYLKFFEIALKSANETKYWLILIREGSLSFKSETNQLLKEVDELSKVIASSILTLKGKR